MKKSRVFAILLSLTLASAPAWAETNQPVFQKKAMPPQGMVNPGCRMMGGSGMGMGRMMDGWGMRPGMIGRRGMQPCMMGGCWQAGRGMGMGWGHMGAMRHCPGPRQTLRNAFHELKGYQMNAAALGLSEDQQQRLDDIEESLTTTAIKARADLQIASIELRRIMAKEIPDVGKADNVVDRKSKMWTDLQKTAIKAVAEARRVLTPEQRQKIGKMTREAGPMMQTPMEQEDEEMSDHEMPLGQGGM